MASRNRRRHPALRVIIPILVVGLLAGACTSDDDDPPTTSTPAPGAQAGAPAGGRAPSDPDRLVGLRLTEGVATPGTPTTVVDGDELADARIAEIIGRLPAWAGGEDLTEVFAWPAQTLVPPAGGTVVEQPFPPTDPGTAPPEPDVTGPLTVLRAQPEGDVAVAPFVGITFSQPMVPLGTVGQLDDRQVPAAITPTVPGHWEWIGTSTLRFVGDDDRFDRLPMATEYTVTVPAGTPAVSGATLEQEAVVTFRTPPPTLQEFGPEGDSLPLQPVFVTVFDQQIDGAAVLATTTVTADGAAVPIHRATEAEIAADTAATAMISGVPDGRWLAFRPDQPLPADTAFEVDVAEGTPSAEGPLTTTAAATRSGRTFPPLELRETDCDSGSGRCEPGSPIRLSFSNPLDAETFDPSSVTIDPALPDLPMVSGSEILFLGGTTASTTYTVTVPAALTDVHGQSLGTDATVTVEVGPARPSLQPFRTSLTTLDPLVDSSTVTVRSTGRSELRLRVFDVAPDRWSDYQDFLRNSLNQGVPDGALTVPDWPVLTDEVLAVDTADDRTTDTVVDLADELAGADGHLVVLVEPAPGQQISQDERWQNQPTATWVQATDLGVDAWADPARLLVWVTDLSTGSPLPDVRVTPIGSDATAATDAQGQIRFDLDERITGLIAERDGDVAVLPADQWMGGWEPSAVRSELRWYVDDDRQTYRPGETVSLKGWVRVVDPAAQLTAMPDTTTLDWVVRDPMGTELTTGTAEPGGLGGFDLTVDLPDGTALGQAWIEFTVSGVPGVDNRSYTHAFTVADFRTPDFEVEVGAATGAPQVAGSPFTLDAGVTYYAGGPLGAAPVDWQVRTAPASYAPAGWTAFTFGLWTPWWWDHGYDTWSGGRPGDIVDPDAKVDEFSGVTDATGAHHLQIEVGDLGADLAGLPATVTAQATATDVNGQALAGSTDVLVHPAAYYVGLSTPSTFVRQDEALTVSAVVTDIDGAAVAGREVTVRAAQVVTRWVNGLPEETEVADGAQECLVTSTTEAVTCSFDPVTGGTLHLTATVTDDDGRSSRSRLTRWVGGAVEAPTTFVEQESVTLVPDRADYEPGGTATVLVQSPIVTGTGLLTIGRVGVESARTFEIVDGSAVLEIPIADTDIPTVNLGVEVVGASPRTGPDGQPLTDAPTRPAFAAGALSLEVSTATRELEVTATPRAADVAPGGSTTVDVSVRDAVGEPVSGSEFQLVVVDEAVLAVGGAAVADPMDVFYAPVRSRVQPVYGRSSIALGTPGGPEGLVGFSSDSASQEESAGGATPNATMAPASAEPTPASAREAAPGAPIADRTDFTPLAVFEPSVVTGADGTATVDVTLPDNLTRYRVLVVAVAGTDRFGSAEATITAGLPLTVRPTAPRFLNFGDTFTLPVIVQNTGAQERTVEVVLQTDNLTTTAGAAGDRTGKQVVVPAGDRVEVQFEVAAAEVGTGRLRVAVVGGDDADAATVDLPVYTPATSESFAGYGIVDGGTAVSQPVLGPTGVIEQFGGLEISTSSTALATLTDAVLYLTDYEYENADGLASQVLAVATLGEILLAFDVPGIPGETELRVAMEDKIGRLVALQNDDGGFPSWERGRESEPFHTVRVVQALAVASTAGYVVPPETLARGVSYLVDIRIHLPAEMSEQDKDTVEAAALAARSAAGDRDSARADQLVADRGDALPLDALAWLWPVVESPAADQLIEARVTAAAVDTAGAVTFTESIDDGDWTLLRSDRRTDALILDALVQKRPESDLVPKAVTGLLAAQGAKGRWATAQENSVALVALKRYYDAFEATPADFVSRVWLGERFAGEHAFVGRTDEISALEIPTADLVATGDTAVTIANDGTGRLYYRMGLRTAPAETGLEPLDRGFVVQRRYEAVDDPADVVREADGSWTIRAGAVVRVSVDLVARSDRTGAALVDPLPAGLEILNPVLATTPLDLTGGTADAAPRPGGWYGTWFEHQNLRDDRAEAYASILPAGDYNYSYLARATTPGSFVAPPTRAEEMYAPETFGRSGTDRVVVK